jgi:Protein of unknown function (DUF1329)
MNYPWRLIVFSTAIAAGSCFILPRLANCQKYDPALYAPLADSNAPEIPEGTVITLENWQKYKQYMTVALQQLFAGTYPFHLDASNPEYKIVVGPRRPILLPKQYISDTEKYSGQVKLRRLDTGGYTLDGYVAGVPFPNPTEPDLAAKLMYNGYYRFEDYIYDTRPLTSL